MVSVSQPYCLLLLLLLPLAAWCWLRRRKTTLSFPSFSLLLGLPGGRSRWVRWGIFLLRMAALLLLIIATAGPTTPDMRSRLPTEGIAIIMVVDVSGSMNEDDFELGGKKITRLEAVKTVFALFVEGGDLDNGENLAGRENDLIGLVTFAGIPESVCPPTLSHSVLLDLLAREQPRTTAGEGHTNISDALILALKRLQQTPVKRKVLVLLSDGEHNVPVADTGSELTPRAAAQLVGNLGITLYTIDAAGPVLSAKEGSGSESNLVETRKRGVETLKELATIGKGKYFEAGDTHALQRVCQEIDLLERDRIDTFQYRRHHEYYPWFGLGAFACWFLTAVLEMTLWRRAP